MNPATVSAATGTSDQCSAASSPQEGPAAVLAGLLADCDHWLKDREDHEVLLGVLRDLAGYPVFALPELAFRLMCQRMSARSENHHAEAQASRPGTGQVRSVA